MRVHPRNVRPGQVLLQDVMSKTKYPMMERGTVLTDLHITVLNKFSVKEVHVSDTLEIEEDVVEKNKSEKVVQKVVQAETKLDQTFHDQYMAVVEQYKQHFLNWENHGLLDFQAMRNLIIPLLNQVKNNGTNIVTLYKLATAKDYPFHHSVSVALLSAYIAMKLTYPKQKWLEVGMAGFLSDTGMAKVTIQNKTKPLTSAERKEVEKHPTYSYQFIKDVRLLTEGAKLAVLQHHERNDGTGYPLQLRGDNIHPYAKIIAVCDTFHAIICERLHQNRQSVFLAMEEIKKLQYTKFEPTIVQELVKQVANKSVRAKVKLSNGTIGTVIFVDHRYPTRPMIKLVETEEIISLREIPSIYISEIIS